MKVFLMEQGGATMVEYAIMLGLIAMVSILTVGAIGISVENVFAIVDVAMSVLP